MKRPHAGTDRLSDVELEAWQGLLRAHTIVTHLLDAELRAAHGIGLGDHDILVHLARAGDRRLRMTDLSRRTMLPPSSLTRVVDRLVRSDLVRRDRSTADSRVVFAVLTPTGERCVRGASGTHRRGIREHLTSRLDEVQLCALAEALGSITEAHQTR